MQTMAQLWRWLECRFGRTAVMAEWRDRAEGALCALEGMLTPLERRARAYPNPRGGHPLKIVRHRDGVVVAVDQDDWRNRVDLQPGDDVLYRLDLRALRKALCDALEGVNIARTSVDQAALCLQIGNWEPKRAASFPVYLLLCASRRALRRQVLELQHRSRRPGAILLTPTRVNWNDTIEATARSGKMLLIPICEIVEVAGDRLIETAEWEEYLQAFAQMVKLTLPSNYRNKTPNARRASLMAKVEKVKNALVDHIRSARDGVVANIDAGKGPQLVHFLTKTDLAKLAGLKPYHVTRCFAADPQLKRLYQIANDPEELLRFGR